MHKMLHMLAKKIILSVDFYRVLAEILLCLLHPINARSHYFPSNWHVFTQQWLHLKFRRSIFKTSPTFCHIIMFLTPV